MKHQNTKQNPDLSNYLGVAVHLIAACVPAFSGASMSPLFVVMLASGMLCVTNIATKSDPSFAARHRPLYLAIGAGVVIPLVAMFFTTVFGTNDGFAFTPFRIAMFLLITSILVWSMFRGFGGDTAQT